MITLIVTFFGVGRLYPAPGTWASLAATILAVLLYRAGGTYLLPIFCLLAIAVGFWAVPLALVDSTEPDPGDIVIDEVAGQWLALCFTMIPLARHNVPIMSAWPAFVVPFLMFRLFDVWKPWLVGAADRRGDPIGLMLDDLWAGLFAGLTAVLLAGIYHGLFR